MNLNENEKRQVTKKPWVIGSVYWAIGSCKITKMVRAAKQQVKEIKARCKVRENLWQPNNYQI